MKRVWPLLAVGCYWAAACAPASPPATCELELGAGVTALADDVKAIKLSALCSRGSDPAAGVNVTLSVTGVENRVTADRESTGADGRVAFELRSRRAEQKQVRLLVEGVEAGVAAVRFLHGPAARLAFVDLPAVVSVGVTVAPAIRVQVLDALGNVAVQDNRQVQLEIDPSSKQAYVVGRGPALSVAGEARFPALMMAAPGVYTLRATSAGLTPAVGTPTEARHFRIVDFAADLREVAVGEPVTLSWTTEHVALGGLALDGTPVAAAGSQSVVPFPDASGPSERTYVLREPEALPRTDPLQVEEVGGEAVSTVTIVAMDDGGELITGYFSGTFRWGESTAFSTTDVGFAARRHSDGTPRWLRTATGQGRMQLTAAVSDGNGGAWVAALVEQSVVFGGATLTSTGPASVIIGRLSRDGVWSTVAQLAVPAITTVLPDDLVATVSGELRLSGWFSESLTADATTLVSAGGRDLFLVAVRTTGEIRWAKRFGGVWDDDPGGLVVAGEDDVLVSFMFKGTIDVGGREFVGELVSEDSVVARIDADGSVLWSVSASGVGQQRISATAATDSGQLLAAGSSCGDDVLVGDAHHFFGGVCGPMLLRLTAQGEVERVERLSSLGQGAVTNIFPLTGGAVALLSEFNGSVDVDGEVVVSSGRDLWFCRLEEDGSVPWQLQFGTAADENSSAGMIVRNDGRIVAAVLNDPPPRSTRLVSIQPTNERTVRLRRVP